MSTKASDLNEFHRFVGEQLDQGSELTPEDCLDLWRANHPSPEELKESVAAVKRALAQVDRGEGITLAEFDRRFRAKHVVWSSTLVAEPTRLTD